MPLSTYLILQAPQVALIQTTSSTMAFLADSAPAAMGSVDSVNYLNAKELYLGGVYMFNKTDAVIISAGGDKYFIIDEENVRGQELLL